MHVACLSYAVIYVPRSELFFDLVYVTVIGKLGEDLRASEITLSHYFLMLTIIFQFWLNSTQYSTRFNNDDLYHKVTAAAA